MPESTPEALQQQIEDLQRQLAQQRAERGQDSSAPYERSEVHQVIGEQIKEAAPELPTSGASVSAGGTPSYQDPALAPQIQQLVNVAFTQSVSAAIAQAVKTGNAALVDALHDVLADQLYVELVSRQKLQSAS